MNITKIICLMQPNLNFPALISSSSIRVRPKTHDKNGSILESPVPPVIKWLKIRKFSWLWSRLILKWIFNAGCELKRKNVNRIDKSVAESSLAFRCYSWISQIFQRWHKRCMFRWKPSRHWKIFRKIKTTNWRTKQQGIFHP